MVTYTIGRYGYEEDINTIWMNMHQENVDLQHDKS
jgi:hypothetical protein